MRFVTNAAQGGAEPPFAWLNGPGGTRCSPRIAQAEREPVLHFLETSGAAAPSSFPRITTRPGPAPRAARSQLRSCERLREGRGVPARAALRARGEQSRGASGSRRGREGGRGGVRLPPPGAHPGVRTPISWGPHRTATGVSGSRGSAATVTGRLQVRGSPGRGGRGAVPPAHARCVVLRRLPGPPRPVPSRPAGAAPGARRALKAALGGGGASCWSRHLSPCCSIASSAS